MYVRALAIDEHAVRQLARSAVSRDFFRSFCISDSFSRIGSIVIDGIVYIFSKDSQPGERLLVVDESSCSLSTITPNPFDPFERIVTLGISKFESDVSLPFKWGPYSDGSRKGSFFAFTAAKGSRSRIFYEDKFSGTDNIFVYDISSKHLDFESVQPNRVLFDDVILHSLDALIKFDELTFSTDHSEGLVEISTIPEGFSRGWSLEEWFDSRLTREQRDFVEKDYEHSVRLRGAAGTGKTISLIVKYIRDILSFEAHQKKTRILFLTHSKVTSQLVQDIIRQLDRSGSLETLSFAHGRIATIFEIANEFVQREQRGVSPIDVDAYEGRRLQKELVSSIIRESRLTLATQFADESDPSFIERLLSDDAVTRERMEYEVLNEFMSVLDAEGIRSGNPKSKEYVDRPRPEWMAKLLCPGDRKIVLDLHRRYRQNLREMQVISVDQLIADFVSYLDSNMWDNLVSRDGYDAIFVDELHLFSPLERMSLKPLMRETGDFGGQPMFMAYDLKQTTKDFLSDYFTSKDTASHWIGRTSEGSDLVELNRVFRFTPEIGRCISDIAISFADIEFLDDIDRQVGVSATEGGSVPELREFGKNLQMYEWAFGFAREEAQRVGSGRRVCVLSMNDEMFGVYRDAGRHAGSFVSIESREDLNGIRYAGKRFIYSTPEYVAGLQFDCVIVLHSDRGSIDDSDLGPLRRRRNLSRLYLAASRAASNLIFCTSGELGGVSPVFTTAIAKGSVVLQG